MSEDNLDTLANNTGFIERKRKITAFSFVKSLIFNAMPHNKQSLVDIKSNMLDCINENISKVAVHKKFKPEAANFMKTLLNQLMDCCLTETSKDIPLGKFSSINIKDSSKFKLPIHYQKDYPSYGSYNKQAALMNMQFEYDLLSGSWNCIELTKATRNDQADSKETADDICSNGLYIRDLGYITTTYLLAVCRKNAYFINRLPKIGVYILSEGEYKPINWTDLDKKLKKTGNSCHEIDVYLGKNEKIKCRMIIKPVPEEVSIKRIRKAAQGGKRKEGYQISKEYKIKSRYNIFVTNVPKKTLNRQQIVDSYRLRWQIEIIFKTWKSNLQIHKMKAMKSERMECQLIAKLIWILINTRLHHVTHLLLLEKFPDKGCSIFKFLKVMSMYPTAILENYSKTSSFIAWFNKTIPPILKDLSIEKRLKEESHIQILNSVLLC